MALAVDQNHAAWPQKRDYWCGVADLTAINWYDQMKTFGTGVSPQYRTQDSIGDDTRGHLSPDGEYYNPDPSNGLLNATPAAFSPWGAAYGIAGGHGPAFKADIAPDAGTDPRSLAWGAYTITPKGCI
jgi:hypothetical protein